MHERAADRGQALALGQPVDGAEAVEQRAGLEVGRAGGGQRGTAGRGGPRRPAGLRVAGPRAVGVQRRRHGSEARSPHRQFRVRAPPGTRSLPPSVPSRPWTRSRTSRPTPDAEAPSPRSARRAGEPVPGAFVAGDRVQLTDPKGRLHTVVLEPGKQFHTHRGAIAHDDLIGAPEGSWCTRRPTPATWRSGRCCPTSCCRCRAAPRSSTRRTPPRSSASATSSPGMRVLEAGAGSGALTCSLLRAVGSGGRVTSYERREDFADVARGNVGGVLRRGAGELVAAPRRPGRAPGRGGGRPRRPRHAGAVGGAADGGRGAASRWRPRRLRGDDDAAVHLVEALREQAVLTEPHAVGDAAAALARRRARRAPGAPDGGAHRVPRHRPAAGRGPVAPVRQRRAQKR